MLFKENWIKEVISYDSNKIINDIKVPGIILPHPKYSITQLLMLGIRYFKIITIEDFLKISKFAIRFKEIIFVDLSLIDYKQILEMMQDEKVLTDIVLLQKDIKMYNFIKIKINSLISSSKFIIPIHPNLFSVFETQFDSNILNIVKYTDFKEKSNIYILNNEMKDNKDLEDIILMNF